MSTINANETYTILGSTLQGICDAVKEQTGASSVAVPDLPEKIKNIGPGDPTEMPKDVIFIDYDGTVIEEYDLAEYRLLPPATAQGYTTNYVPTPPTHTGLTFQEWNYADADITTYLNDIGCAVIGANYTTDDGKDRFYIDIEDSNELALKFQFYNLYTDTITIDWGDGTTTSGTYSSAYQVANHTYSALGQYVIKLSRATASYHQMYYNRAVITPQTNTGTYGTPAAKCLKKIETGASCFGFAYSALLGAVCLKSVSLSTSCEYTWRSYNSSNNFWNTGITGLVLPRGSLKSGNFEFSFTENMKYISLPASFTAPGGILLTASGVKCIYLAGLTVDPPSSIAPYCSDLKRVVISTISNVAQTGLTSGRFLYSSKVESVDLSKSYITTLYTSTVQYCMWLRELKLPNTITAVNASAIYGCYNLQSIDFSGCDITSIAGTAFYGCYNCLVYDFTGCTTVPTLANTNAFTGIHTNAKIVVPDSLVSSWKAASNWSTYASYIVGESDV